VTVPAASLGLGYRPPAGAWDELLDGGGVPRAHWHGLLDALGALGHDELTHRREQIGRQLREHGVHDLPGPGSTTGTARVLDPVPLVLPAEEWRTLSAGLVQRARLLDAWLADCYGAQATLCDGVVPPALVLGDPGFLRPCHGVPAPGERRLHLVGIDCVRADDGRWRVLGHCTSAAHGIGLALENRIVLSRSLPEVMRARPVERVAGFFAALRDALRALAPPHREQPRIVLLTPGPTHPAWAEHAYFARYLGLMLVEGCDLTVRDRAVHLKTLGGLERVDVVLRWLDDAACDPLSLDGDPSTGVAGLVQAVRAGRVVVANALGSALAESPGLVPHLPALCRRLLGEDLLLEDAGADLPPATVPCWTADGLVPAPATLRTWVVAERDGGHRVLPGGLARVLAPDGRDGGMTKDTWVLADGPVDPLSLLPPPGQPVTPTRGGAELPSRVADDLLWLGRHVERAEGLARLLRTMLRRLADEAGAGASRTHAALVAALAAVAEAPAARILPSAGRAGDERTSGSALFAEAAEAALRPAVAAALRLGARVRDQISLDTWRVVQRLDRQLPALDDEEPLPLAAALDALDGLVLTLAAFSGLGVENVTRGLGWRFADMGRRIERGRATAALVGATLGDGGDEAPRLDAVLEVTDVSMTYRRRYPAAVQLPAVLDLVLLDETSPRSLAFQLVALSGHVGRLPRDERRALRSAEERLAMAAVTRVRLADLGALCTTRDGGRRTYLGALCESVTSDLAALSDALTHAFLSHADTPHPLGISP